jgi:hypothetical protein
MDYRNLSIAEKIEQVQEYRPCGAEKKHQAAYLNALQTSDITQIAEYEAFGDNPRKIIMNLNSHQQAQAFGFTGMEFNEYGWLANAHFTNVEHIEFFHKKGWAAFNYITIGQGANGKWSYGASYSTGGAGGGYGLGIWGKIFNNRKECLTAALRELLNRHAQQWERLKNDPANFNPTLSNIVVKQVQSMLQETTVAKQLTLLFN